MIITPDFYSKKKQENKSSGYAGTLNLFLLLSSVYPGEDLGYFPEENVKPYSGITTCNTNTHGETVFIKQGK